MRGDLDLNSQKRWKINTKNTKTKIRNEKVSPDLNLSLKIERGTVIETTVTFEIEITKSIVNGKEIGINFKKRRPQIKRDRALSLLKYQCHWKCQCLLFQEKDASEKDRDLLWTTTAVTKITMMANFGTPSHGYHAWTTLQQFHPAHLPIPKRWDGSWSPMYPMRWESLNKTSEIWLPVSWPITTSKTTWTVAQ